ncbi:hypothetical protein HMPREF1544_02322 [Mucor circinelloides 1006PhL]|uniref:RGS domain-containing protein n=1 Tax=Mucor circinelloides f. circinelloides (strain 1006PhL) TaxID=1220926 RepID=S2JLU2_MUCC1|nr:hypothetical protein HMPREF1544_02322 [Mucor circinelloides 1006PhL]
MNMKNQNQSKESLKNLLAGRPELNLHQVLEDPILLGSFESYLTKSWSQENLLFIEAMNQLRHDGIGTSEDAEQIFRRIYNTFIAVNAPLEINVKTQELVRERLSTVQWAIFTRDQALDILKETEEEVLAMLMTKLADFLSSPLATVSTKQSKLFCNEATSAQKRVVIIGGGFTGFTVASILDPMPLFHVTLIDTKDSFEYTPHIVTKVVSPEKSSSLRFTHDSYIKNGKIIIGWAEDICEDAKCVKVNEEKIYFDYLVIACGSSYAGQLKSSDASSIYRMAGLDSIATEIKNAKQILIIGAGLVGCELAAAIAGKTFDSPIPKKKVILVEGRDRIICRGDAKQRKKAEKFLKGLGVEIILNEKIKAHIIQGDYEYAGSSGRTYSSNDYTIFIATGVKVNTSFIETSTNAPSLEECLDKHGLIKVKPTLQLEHWKYNHIFAGGDATNVTEEKTAYAATLAGVCISRNICRMEKGKLPIPQGTKGLLAPPLKTLHGIKSNGGIGKQKLSFFERKLSFLNPTWQVLKYFNEKQFFSIMQHSSRNANIIGRVPKVLSLPKQQHNNNIPQSDSSCHNLIYNHQASNMTDSSSLLSQSSNYTNRPFKRHGIAY